MKILSLVFVMLLSYSSIFGFAQMTADFTSTENDQLISRYSSYILINSNNWTIINTTKFKHSEFQENIDNYYQESYLRNLLQTYFIKRNYSFNLQMGLGISPSENHLLLPEGVNSLVELQNTYSIAGGFLYDNRKIYFDMNLDYLAADYDKYELDISNGEKITEADLTAEVKAGLWFNRELLIYAAADHFNDLNEISAYNYTEYSLNLQYKKRFNYAYYLQQDIALGNSDLDDNLKNFLRTNTRLSTRFAPDWTFLNVLEYELWVDGDNKFYLGNSWLNSIMRRNLKLSEDNELSYIQAAGEYELDTEIGYGEIAADYYIRHFQLEVSEKYYFGDERWLDQKLLAGVAWNFTDANLKIGYSAEMIIYSDKEETLNHNIAIDYRF